MEQTPIWQLDASCLGELLRAGSVSPAVLLRSVLGRLDAVNALTNAVVTRNPLAMDDAEESGRRLRSGAARSRLEGIPVTIKDNLLVRGLRSTWGSRVFEDHVPEHDELPVQRLRDAGAVIVGKTNVPEFTVEGYTSNPVFGTTRNPWNLAATPGGSSGGAVAAVASGIGPIALCTDGGGSIRRPAAHCALVGLKPSIGRIARADGFPRILLDMEVVGPIARTVADARLVLETLSGPDPRDRDSLGCAAARPATASAREMPLRILFVPAFGDEPVDAEILTNVEAAASTLAGLGHHVQAGELPFSLDAITAAWPVIGQVGVARLLRSLPGSHAPVGENALAMARLGGAVAAADYLDIIETIARFRARVATAFERFDMVLTPTTAAMPWPAGEAYPDSIAGRSVGPRGHAVFAGWVNACGHPAISIPCAPSRNGMPVGFQLVGRYGSDLQLLDVAAAYEAVAPWAQIWPDLGVSAG